MPAVDAQQLRALVRTVVKPGDSRRAIAVRSDPVWSGPDVLDGPVPFRVVPCPSPLAVRAALVDHAAGDEQVLAILTPCADRDLGLDVLARLAKGRVLPVDPFSAVLALFGARVLDPTLTRDERWMVDELIELAPAGGWPEPAMGNVLDIDTAWQVWHNARLGRSVPEDLDGVLQLGADPAIAVALGELDDQRRDRVATRWAGGVAPAGLLLELIAKGNGHDVAALGLVSGVLWSSTDDARLADLQRLGRARMEHLLGRDRLDRRSAEAWLEAARRTGVDVVALDRAEQLLADADISELAVLSDDLVLGFDQRLRTLARSVAAGDLDGAVAALDLLQQHRLASSHRNRVLKAEAAVRLVRREQHRSSAPAPSDFAGLAHEYAREGAWVDEARLLLADGEHLADVAAGYADLCAKLDLERRAGDLAFAGALAEWSGSEPIRDERIVPVEEVLDRVVARVAADAPVLVLVCDGVSLPVTHQLLDSLAEHGWARALPTEIESWPVGVAMLPTVTEVSRASLLAGDRIDGGQKEEANGFAGHSGLRQASVAARPPVLYHKGQLVGPSGHALADEVQTNVADPGQRIVGVVLNAVDDHLSRGQQVKVAWNVETMGPLGSLIEAARDAGRVIVLTADHGHVIHGEGAKSRPTGRDDGGERWRTSPPVATTDEVEVAGPRVLKGGRVVLPADDRIRYGGHKHGYHGGACPHEVLVPVEVVARSLPPGWVHRPLPRPQWWTGEIEQPWAAPPVAAPPPTPTTAQPTLFEPEPAEPIAPSTVASPPSAVGDSLVDRLLSSPAFAAQRQRNQRANALNDDRIGRYLQLMVANGGTIPLATLADRTGEPADQLRMSLMMVRRLLNFDGTEVLGISPTNDVELNDDLLRLQFDM
jgi:hypothetical protein